MGPQYGTIVRHQFGSTGYANDNHPIRKDRRFLRLVGQSMYATKRDEKQAQYYQEEHPSSASSKSTGHGRLVGHTSSNRMPARGMSNASWMWAGPNSCWH
jgi:hypothetical protein